MTISGKTLLAGVMGWPVSHSLSPRLHNRWLRDMAIDGAYIPLAVRPQDAAEVIAMAGRMGFRGLNITVPHKEAALMAVDHVDDLVRRTGAVNTILYDDNGDSHGTNTDGFGFLENIRQHQQGWDFTNGPAVILGAGGAARAIATALMNAGAPEIRLCNRTLSRARKLADTLKSPDAKPSEAAVTSVTVVDWADRNDALPGASLLVNTTTLGMTGQEPLDIRLDALPESALVNDIVYAPPETPLLRTAQDRGNPVVDGIGMLLHQARPGFEAWFGRAPVVDGALRQYVLVGTQA